MEERPLVVGAVATHPDSVLVWDALRGHFTELGAPMDYNLYSTVDRLTDQLVSGFVDVAWLSPLSYVRARRKVGGMVVPLLVGDRHRDLRSHLVARSDAALALGDLRGSTVAVGARDDVAARALPLFHLREAGVDLASLTLLPFDIDVGKGGETRLGGEAVLGAVLAGRAPTGLVCDRVWSATGQSGIGDRLQVLWSTPPYDGPVFCALASGPTGLRLDFERAMRAMDPANPRHADILARCGVSGWVPARESGYQAVRRALDEMNAW